MARDFTITIDIPTLDRSIERIARSYTTFGEAVRSVAGGVEGDVRQLLNEASDVSLPLKPLMQADEDLYPAAKYISMEEYLRQWDRGDRRLTDTVEKMGALKLGSAVEGAMAEGAIEPPPIDIPVPAVSAASNKADGALKEAEKSFEKIHSTEEKAIKRISVMRSFIEKEVRSAKGSIRDLIAQIPGGLVGGFVSGLIGTIILGYQERNRRRAEMGEMANMFVGGLDSVFSDESRKAVRWFGNWAERAQWHYGIARQEVQKTISEMVNNGFKTAEMIESYDRNLKGSGRNVVITSIALDKHFNFATGTSMENIVNLVREYGMELKGATDFYLKMTMAGQRSGIGTMNFIRAVMSSREGLSRFGINAENVAVLMEKVIGFYTEMGLNQRYAGQQAVGVVQDLMTAFSNLDDGMKVVLARRMYNDEETDALTLRNQFMDGLRRIREGDDDQFIENLLRSYVEIMRETGLGGRSRMIRTFQEHLGVRNRTAQLLYDAGDLISKGGKLKDLTKEERGNVKRAFAVQGMAVSRLHRTRRELVRGMAMLGESLTAIVADIFGILIIGARSLPALVWGYQNNQLDQVVRIVVAEQKQRISAIADHWKKGAEGVDLVVTALGSEFAGVFQPVVDAMTGKIKQPPPAPPTLPVQVAEAAAEIWEGREDYEEVGERFEEIYLKKEAEEQPFTGLFTDTPFWDTPLIGLKLPFQDEITGYLLQSAADKDLAGESDWAKKNPSDVAAMREKAAEGYRLDPVTGIMKNPKTGERWSVSEGQLPRAKDKDYGALPIKVGVPKHPRTTDVVNEADKAAADNIF